MNPNNGTNAKANDPATWSTFEVASRAVETFNFDGVGFQFGLGSDGNKYRVSGIDLDHVIHAYGSLEPFAAEIVKIMDSYTEISPSGTGLHILCVTTLPDIGNKLKLDNGYALERYNHSRYFTVTGNVFGEARPVAERTSEYISLHTKFFLTQNSTKNEKSVPVTTTHARELSDEELIARMLNSSKGDKIKRLFEGDISGYSSQSEADLALCVHLAFWTHHDEARIDRLFRQSKLMRDKWNGDEYRTRTIRKALETQLHDDEFPLSSPTIQPTQSTLPLKKTTGRNVTDYLTFGFTDDLAHFSLYKSRRTGYSNLDAITSLYPGLYVLGAVTSLGKTTFAHQMADQLAQAGEHVLYFSLEQSMCELTSKGLSRLTAQIDLRNAVSAIKIREGWQPPIVQNAIKKYMSFSSHNNIYVCGFDTSVIEIITEVQEYIRNNNVKPIVFIDYLQIIPPFDSRMSTKDTVDSHVRAFKKLQIENDLVVIVISSLNRQNYLSPIDYESFKESGGIEYTADVVWGLQLSIMNDADFIDIKSLTEKRQKVRDAKAQNPRKVELVCLKNRYGTSSYTCAFKYYAMFDYFEPIEDKCKVLTPPDPPDMFPSMLKNVKAANGWRPTL